MADEMIEPTPVDAEGAVALEDDAEFERIASSMSAGEPQPKAEGTGDDEGAGEGEGERKQKPAAEPKDGAATVEGDEQEPDLSETEAGKRLAELAGGEKPKADAGKDGAGAGEGEGKPKAEEKPPKESGQKPAAKTDGEDPTITWTDPETGKPTEMKASEWEKQFPDFAGYVAHKASVLARQTIEAMIADGKIVTGDTAKNVGGDLARINFDLQVGRKHPDWAEHAKEGTDFRKWVDRLPEAQKQLFYNGGVKGAITLLDAFAERQRLLAERKAKDTSKLRAEKQRTDDLHGGSMSGGGIHADGEGELDEEAAFAKIADKLERESRGQKRK